MPASSSPIQALICWRLRSRGGGGGAPRSGAAAAAMLAGTFNLSAAPTGTEKTSGQTAVAGSDWPQWRGPNRDDHSPDTGLLKEWPAGGPKLIWKGTGIGSGFSSVSLGGG